MPLDEVQRLPSLDYAALAETVNVTDFAGSSFVESPRVKTNSEFHSDFFTKAGGEMDNDDLLENEGNSLLCPSDELAYEPPFHIVSWGGKDDMSLLNQGTSLDNDDHVGILLDIDDPFDERHFALDYIQMKGDVSDNTAPSSKVHNKGDAKKSALMLPMEILESARKQREYSNKKSGKESPRKYLYATRKSHGRSAVTANDKDMMQARSRKLKCLDEKGNMSGHMKYGSTLSSPLEAGWTNEGSISDTVYHGVRARRPVNPDSFQDGDELIFDCPSKGAPLARGKYRCGRCGKPKINHECEYVEECAVSSQGQQWCVDIVDQSSMQPFKSEYYLAVSKRKSIFDDERRSGSAYIYAPPLELSKPLTAPQSSQAESASGDSSSRSSRASKSSQQTISKPVSTNGTPSGVEEAGFAVDENGNYFYLDGNGSAFPLILGEDGAYYPSVPIAIAIAHNDG